MNIVKIYLWAATGVVVVVATTCTAWKLGFSAQDILVTATAGSIISALAAVGASAAQRDGGVTASVICVGIVSAFAMLAVALGTLFMFDMQVFGLSATMLEIAVGAIGGAAGSIAVLEYTANGFAGKVSVLDYDAQTNTAHEKGGYVESYRW